MDGTANGLNETNIANQNIKLYPNPNAGIFTIETEINSQISIYNVLGNLILKQTAINPKTILDITHYKIGIYFVTVNNGYSLNSVKIIKE